MKIKEKFSTALTKSIFNSLGSEVPWFNDVSRETLDGLYILHSGDKTIAEKIEVLSVATCGLYIRSLNLHNWNTLWKSYQAEYNPIDNYNMIEESTDDATENGSNSNSRTLNYGSTNNHTSNATGSNNTTENTSAYAFNSATASPTDSRTVGETNTNNFTESNTRGGQDIETNSGTDSKTAKTTHRLTRSGNIGVTTSAQMIGQEIELWKWKYFETVFNDIDNVLALSVYEDE